MKLIQIPYASVQADSTEYNTSFYTQEEAPDAKIASEAPYSFKRWLPLILISRDVSAQTIHLTRSQTKLLLDATQASVSIREINRIYREDLEVEIYPSLAVLHFPPEGLFMRFDACSAKDGVSKIPRKRSLHSSEEIVRRIVTSPRARNALHNALLEEWQPGQMFDLFFLPFNPHMRSEFEYRVFCPPGTERIAAISQYRWHHPWHFKDRSEVEKRKIAEYIAAEAEKIRADIMVDLDEKDKLDALFLQQGFTFDVFYDEEEKSFQLVELNVFGVLSACGSCLFNWICDREVLEGKAANDELEFRVMY
ncbi:hypothetical protein HD806DRAFT_483757 [Xylariaceae sp. AK1471]|nr:hypothetical protein HD806DRAFT_483757 [Xylariaceae sp. AK1471]